MGLFNKEVELIIPTKKQNNTNYKTIKVNSLNGYDAIREKIDEGNTLSVHASAMRRTPVDQPTKPKTKVSIGL